MLLVLKYQQSSLTTQQNEPNAVNPSDIVAMMYKNTAGSRLLMNGM